MRVISRSSRSHSCTVCVLPSCVTVARGIELGGSKHGLDGPLGVAMHDAERVAGLVQFAETRESELDVAHFAQRAAAHDALVREHFGRGRLGAVQFLDGRSRRGRRGANTGRRSTRGLELLGVLTHARERVVGPGLRELLEIDVAIDARQQALGAELGEPLVDHAARFAELGIAGVTQRQHRVLQLR